MGYENQPQMECAIRQFGWNNVKHYILFEGLGKEAALFIEAALIEKWHTYRKGKGYNIKRPNLPGLENFIVPDFKKTIVHDPTKYSMDEIYVRRRDRREAGRSRAKTKRVICVETGEVFDSVTDAALSIMVPTSVLSKCIIKLS